MATTIVGFHVVEMVATRPLEEKAVRETERF
jgi:hypothetical protein